MLANVIEKRVYKTKFIQKSKKYIEKRYVADAEIISSSTFFFLFWLWNISVLKLLVNELKYPQITKNNIK